MRDVIGILPGHHGGARCAKADVQRARDSHAPARLEDRDSAVRAGADDVERAIHRSIIDDDDFEGVNGLREQTVDRGADEPGRVAHGHQDRHLGAIDRRHAGDDAVGAKTSAQISPQLTLSSRTQSRAAATSSSNDERVYST